MLAYWGIAAHSSYDMFSWYKYLNVILFFPIPRFMEWEFLLIAPFPDHCLLLPFSKCAVNAFVNPVVSICNVYKDSFGITQYLLFHELCSSILDHLQCCKSTIAQIIKLQVFPRILYIY